MLAKTNPDPNPKLTNPNHNPEVTIPVVPVLLLVLFTYYQPTMTACSDAVTAQEK